MKMHGEMFVPLSVRKEKSYLMSRNASLTIALTLSALMIICMSLSSLIGRTTSFVVVLTIVILLAINMIYNSRVQKMKTQSDNESIIRRVFKPEQSLVVTPQTVSDKVILYLNSGFAASSAGLKSATITYLNVKTNKVLASEQVIPFGNVQNELQHPVRSTNTEASFKATNKFLYEGDADFPKDVKSKESAILLQADIRNHTEINEAAKIGVLKTIWSFGLHCSGDTAREEYPHFIVA